MIGNRVKSLVDREPLGVKVNNAVTSRTHKARQRPGKRLERRLPDFQNRNIGRGTAIGAVASGIAVILEDTVGVPFGASSDIVDSRSDGNATVYTVNVNAPTEHMAQARAMIDSTTGFSSFLTDKLDVENLEVEKTRIFRDTFQAEIRVEN